MVSMATTSSRYSGLCLRMDTAKTMSRTRPPYTPRHARFTVKLSCDCLLLSHHTEGDMACPRGHGYRAIVGYYSKEWRARCVAPKCRFNQWCGQDKAGAVRSGARHETRPGHMVAILYDNIRTPVTVDILRTHTVGSTQELNISGSSEREARIRKWADSLGAPPY